LLTACFVDFRQVVGLDDEFAHRHDEAPLLGRLLIFPRLLGVQIKFALYKI
jgi:hypothetical protein